MQFSFLEHHSGAEIYRRLMNTLGKVVLSEGTDVSGVNI